MVVLYIRDREELGFSSEKCHPKTSRNFIHDSLAALAKPGTAKPKNAFRLTLNPSRDVPFFQLQYVQYTYHGLALCSSSFCWQYKVSIRNRVMQLPCGCVDLSIVTGLIVEIPLVLFFTCNAVQQVKYR